MTKSNISQYDATASNNTDIDGTDIAENCSPAGINNAIRSLMSHLKQMDVGTVALTSPKVTGDFTVDTTTLHVDSTNNRVGIGTSTPAHTLAVSGSSNSTYLSTGGDDASNARGLTFTSSASASFNGAVHTINALSSQGVIAFATASNERGRFDSSGRLLIGHTTAKGYALDIDKANLGAAGFNRTGSDGEIVALLKDGTQVASIVSVSGVVSSIVLDPRGSGTQGVGLGGTNLDSIFPCDRTGAPADNLKDMGVASVRFDDIFATNATIQTSDQNEKQDIASLTSAEITAAKAISKLFKTFKWKDKVVSKGESARTHAGVIAQEVQSAMSDAGLDATKYAFFCSDTWWEKDVEVAAVEADEENGIEAQDAYTRTDTYNTKDEAPEGATERTRLGVRYPELLAFVGAATEQRLADIETRLAALEG